MTVWGSSNTLNRMHLQGVAADSSRGGQAEIISLYSWNELLYKLRRSWHRGTYVIYTQRVFGALGRSMPPNRTFPHSRLCISSNPVEGEISISPIRIAGCETQCNPDLNRIPYLTLSI